MKCYKCGTSYPFDSSTGRQTSDSFPKIKSAPRTPPPWAFGTYPLVDQQAEKQAHDTDRGLLLLAAGLVLGPIPLIGVLGDVLALIGAIFVIMGRNAFGEKHSRLVVLGAIAYSISFVILFSIGASIPMQLQSTFQASNTAADLPTRLNNVIYSYLIAVVVIGLILNLATVGFTYAIQNRVGKSLLWMSFGISVLLLIPAFVLISGLSQAISTSVASNDPSSLYTFVGQAEAFRLLGIIPAIFFAIAYLNARGRIGNGEIPEMLLPQQSV